MSTCSVLLVIDISSGMYNIITVFLNVDFFLYQVFIHFLCTGVLYDDVRTRKWQFNVCVGGAMKHRDICLGLLYTGSWLWQR